MWILISIAFALAGIISNKNIYWVVFGLLIVAHNVEYLAIQVKKLADKADDEKEY